MFDSEIALVLLTSALRATPTMPYETLTARRCSESASASKSAKDVAEAAEVVAAAVVMAAVADEVAVDAPGAAREAVDAVVAAAAVAVVMADAVVPIVRDLRLRLRICQVVSSK